MTSSKKTKLGKGGGGAPWYPPLGETLNKWHNCFYYKLIQPFVSWRFSLSTPTDSPRSRIMKYPILLKEVKKKVRTNSSLRGGADIKFIMHVQYMYMYMYSLVLRPTPHA